MVKGSVLYWAFRPVGMILHLFRCPPSVENESTKLRACESPPSETPPACKDVKCYVLKLVELVFDFSYGLLSDPIAAWRTVVSSGVYFFQGQLSSVVRMFGLFCAFILVNVLVFVGMRVVSFFMLVRRVVLACLRLPIFVLLFRLAKWLWVGVAGPDEGKKSKREDRLASSATTRDVSAAPQRGCVADGQFEGALRLDPKDPVECAYCGRFGHPAENCLVRLRAIGLLRDWPRGGMRDGQRKEKRVTPEEVKREGKQPHVSATGRTLMYTPGFIAGHKFRKCLVDNASQANIISVKACTKYGLVLSPGEIKTLYDFNDQEVPVQGHLTAKLSSLGPSKQEREVVFQVTSDTSAVVIGLQTLGDLGIIIDSKASSTFVCKREGDGRVWGTLLTGSGKSGRMYVPLPVLISGCELPVPLHAFGLLLRVANAYDCVTNMIT